MSEDRKPEAIFNSARASLSLAWLDGVSVDQAETLLAMARMGAGVGCRACNGFGALPGHRCNECGGSGRIDQKWQEKESPHD